MRERGAWDAPWFSSCSGIAAGSARLHAPRIGRSSPARVGELVRPSRRGSPRGIRPRVLSSIRSPGSACQEGHPIAFLDPPVFVSGGRCRTVRFASQPARVSQDLLLGHAPVANGLLNRTRDMCPSPEAMPPRRPTPRHPEFGRLEISLRQGMRIIREAERCRITFLSFFRRALESLRNFRKALRKICGVGAAL
jgi:hypothetical protein